MDYFKCLFLRVIAHTRSLRYHVYGVVVKLNKIAWIIVNHKLWTSKNTQNYIVAWTQAFLHIL